MKLLLVVTAMLLGASVAHADQYSCETVDQSAVAYVNINVPVSKLETERRCALAVDGATATGSRSRAFVGAMNNLNYELFEAESSRGIPPDMLIDLFTGPFGPDSNDPAGGDLVRRAAESLFPEDNAVLEGCLFEFAYMLGPQYEYGDVYDFGERSGPHARCRVVLPSDNATPLPGPPISSGGALQIEFAFEDRVLTLFIPAAFFIDARDGNGTFN